MVGSPPTNGIWENFYVNKQCIAVCYPEHFSPVPALLAATSDNFVVSLIMQCVTDTLLEELEKYMLRITGMRTYK